MRKRNNFTKRTLREHLNQIDQNSCANNNNFRSLKRRLKQHFINAGYPNAANVPSLIEQYMHMIFETQGYRCTHWLETKDDELNGVWNRPGYNYNCWRTEQVFFEIDHVLPKNSNGLDRLDNLQFLSANANQFTKCSLRYDDLLKRVDLSDRLKNRIKEVLKNRQELFRSTKWEQFIEKLETIEGRR